MLPTFISLSSYGDLYSSFCVFWERENPQLFMNFSIVRYTSNELEATSEITGYVKSAEANEPMNERS